MPKTDETRQHGTGPLCRQVTKPSDPILTICSFVVQDDQDPEFLAAKPNECVKQQLILRTVIITRWITVNSAITGYRTLITSTYFIPLPSRTSFFQLSWSEIKSRK